MTSQDLDRCDTVVLDVDGTLVDSVYHHVTAWDGAFAEAGVGVALWRVHRAIGMGGDRLVAAVGGDEVERTHGDRLREGHGRRYAAAADKVRALPGASALIHELRRRDRRVVLATSGDAEQTARSIDLLDVGDLDLPVASGSDVNSSKPASDLVDRAVALVGGESGGAVMVGDSVWDVEAAARAGMPAIGLRCGGFAAEELREAGASAVYDDPADLLANLDALGLGA